MGTGAPVAGLGGQGWVACGWWEKEEQGEQATELGRGSWRGRQGAGRTGSLGLRPPSAAPRTVPKWGQAAVTGVGPDGECPRHSAGHAGCRPAWPCARAHVTDSGERRAEASRPFHKTLIRQGSHMEGGQPGHSAFRPQPPRPAPPHPTGSCGALGKQQRKSSGNTNPPPSPLPSPP